MLIKARTILQRFGIQAYLSFAEVKTLQYANQWGIRLVRSLIAICCLPFGLLYLRWKRGWRLGNKVLMMTWAAQRGRLLLLTRNSPWWVIWLVQTSLWKIQNSDCSTQINYFKEEFSTENKSLWYRHKETKNAL
jgi:hypothetical protein